MIDVLIVVVAAIAMFAYLWGYHTGRCSKMNPCPKCAVHSDEHKVWAAAEKERQKRMFMDQYELRHEMDHKGQGFKDSDPDRWDCRNPNCTRNRGIDSRAPRG